MHGAGEVAHNGKGPSMVPLLGDLGMLAGCALHPSLGWKLGLLGPLLDPGSALLMIGSAIYWQRQPR